MDHELLHQAKSFLRTYLEDKVCHFEVTHPWRRDSQYIVLHGMRVHRLALKIVALSAEKPTAEEMMTLELASLLHDIGKVHGHECHAERSAEIVEQWAKRDRSIARQVPNLDLLTDVIAKHSGKDEPSLHPVLALLMDADSLDEIGVLSIFMASGHLNHHSPWFFNQLEERLVHTEIPYCEKLMKTLRTSGAQDLLSKDIQFIQYFIQKLRDEVDGTEELYQDFGKNLEGVEWPKLIVPATKTFEL